MSATTDEYSPMKPTFKTGSDMTVDDRMMRIDTLLCILFGGLVAHPLASSIIPPEQIAQLKAILPQE